MPALNVDALQPLNTNEKATLLMLIASGEVSVSQAASLMGWSRRNTSGVLKSLWSRGVVKVREYGTFRLYSVNMW